jgi:hypothetical protein
MRNLATYEQLLAMMDGHLPPIKIPPSREGKDKLTDNEVLTIVGYWKVFDSRLREYFEEAWERRLLAGSICEPWGAADCERWNFQNWLRYSGTGERLGLMDGQAGTRPKKGQ